MEEETIEVTFKSKSIQLKTKKNSSTGLTDALASVHPTLGGSSDAPVGLSLWMQAEIKSTISIAPVEPMVKKISTGALDVLCSREHVLVDLNSPSAPVEPTLQNQAPVHWIYYVPESLFEVDQ